jgi:hypothetical protein
MSEELPTRRYHRGLSLPPRKVRLLLRAALIIYLPMVVLGLLAFILRAFML